MREKGIPADARVRHHLLGPDSCVMSVIRDTDSNHKDDRSRHLSHQLINLSEPFSLFRSPFLSCFYDVILITRCYV